MVSYLGSKTQSSSLPQTNKETNQNKTESSQTCKSPLADISTCTIKYIAKTMQANNRQSGDSKERVEQSIDQSGKLSKPKKEQQNKRWPRIATVAGDTLKEAIIYGRTNFSWSEQMCLGYWSLDTSRRVVPKIRVVTRRKKKEDQLNHHQSSRLLFYGHRLTSPHLWAPS